MNKPLRGNRITLILAISNQRGIVHHEVVKGSANAKIFSNFIHSIEASEDASVLLDNVRFHHSKCVKDAASKKKMTLVYTMAAFTLSLIVGLPLAGESTYTKISLVAGLAAFIQEAFGARRGPSMVPFLFVNSCAILAGFNAACDSDPTALERMAAKSGDSPGTFLLKNAAVHWLPPAVHWLPPAIESVVAF